MEEHLHINKPSPRTMKESELTARMYQRNALEAELDHFVQTHQDPSLLKERLEETNAAIARLQAELRLL